MSEVHVDVSGPFRSPIAGGLAASPVIRVRGVMPTPMHPSTRISARPGRFCRGLTLIELSVAVFLLGLAAAAAAPLVSGYDEERVALAAAEIADLVRLARDESIRTGAIHGVDLDPVAGRVRVYRHDGSLPAPGAVYDVRDPISLALAELDLATHSLVAGSTLTAAPSWRGTCGEPDLVAFRDGATPACGEPMSTLLDQGDYVVSRGSASRTVRIDGLTGRVTIQ